MKHLHLLLDENLPLPKKLKYLTKNQNVKHVNFVGLKGKEDPSVYMASKKLERVLVTFDKNIYLDSRKYRFFEDAGLIYLTSRGSSYDLYPKEIEERLKKLFSVIISRDDYFNVKMKLSDNQVEIKNRKGEIRRIRL